MFLLTGVWPASYQRFGSFLALLLTAFSHHRESLYARRLGYRGRVVAGACSGIRTLAPGSSTLVVVGGCYVHAPLDSHVVTKWIRYLLSDTTDSLCKDTLYT